MSVKNIFFSGFMASILMSAGVVCADTEVPAKVAVGDGTALTTTRYVQGGVRAAEDYAQAYTDNKIEGLDATVDLTTATNGLQLTLTQTDGKVTAITGGITDGTYVTPDIVGTGFSSSYTIKDAIDAIEAASSTDVSDLASRVDSLESRATSHEDYIKQHGNTIDAHALKIAANAAAIEQNKADIAANTAEITEIGDAFETLKANDIQQTAQIQALADKNAEQDADIAANAAAINANAADIETLTGDLAEVASGVNVLNAAVQTIKDNDTAQDAQIQALTDAVEGHTAAINANAAAIAENAEGIAANTAAIANKLEISDLVPGNHITLTPANDGKVKIDVTGIATDWE